MRRKLSPARTRFAALLLAVGAALAPVLATATEVPPPGLSRPGISGWHRAEKTGCLVWNEMPQPDEVVHWTGACVNGLAEGAGQVRWVFGGQEECYLGTMKAGRAHGRGVYVWARGEHYEGEMINGVQTGRLIRRWYEGERYEGDYVENRRTGRGIAVHANGERYEGGFKDGYRHGEGTLTLPNGERFVGTFDMGARGHGVVIPADPTKKHAAPDLRTASDGCDVTS
jgi:hypothetical protein